MPAAITQIHNPINIRTMIKIHLRVLLFFVTSGLDGKAVSILSRTVFGWGDPHLCGESWSISDMGDPQRSVSSLGGNEDEGVGLLQLSADMSFEPVVLTG